MKAEASAFAELARAFADGTRELERATPLQARKAHMWERLAAFESGLD